MVSIGRHRRDHPPGLEEILRESRTVSDRLEHVTGRLEQAVDRLSREIAERNADRLEDHRDD